MLNYKKFFIFIFFSLFFIVGWIQPSLADNYGLEAARNESGLPSYSGSNGNPAVVIGKFVGAVLAFTGTIFFALMIYGGITWMTSAGDEKKVEKAKDLITAAIIGVVIILSAYAIVAYIGTNLTATS